MMESSRIANAVMLELRTLQQQCTKTLRRDDIKAIPKSLDVIDNLLRSSGTVLPAEAAVLTFALPLVARWDPLDSRSGNLMDLIAAQAALAAKSTDPEWLCGGEVWLEAFAKAICLGFDPGKSSRLPPKYPRPRRPIGIIALDCGEVGHRFINEKMHLPAPCSEGELLAPVLDDIHTVLRAAFGTPEYEESLLWLADLLEICPILKRIPRIGWESHEEELFQAVLHEDTNKRTGMILRSKIEKSLQVKKHHLVPEMAIASCLGIVGSMVASALWPFGSGHPHLSLGMLTICVTGGLMLIHDAVHRLTRLFPPKQHLSSTMVPCEVSENDYQIEAPAWCHRSLKGAEVVLCYAAATGFTFYLIHLVAPRIIDTSSGLGANLLALPEPVLHGLSRFGDAAGAIVALVGAALIYSVGVLTRRVERLRKLPVENLLVTPSVSEESTWSAQQVVPEKEVQ